MGLLFTTIYSHRVHYNILKGGQPILSKCNEEN